MLPFRPLVALALSVSPPCLSSASVVWTRSSSRTPPGATTRRSSPRLALKWAWVCVRLRVFWLKTLDHIIGHFWPLGEPIRVPWGGPSPPWFRRNVRVSSCKRGTARVRVCVWGGVKCLLFHSPRPSVVCISVVLSSRKCLVSLSSSSTPVHTTLLALTPTRSNGALFLILSE